MSLLEVENLSVEFATAKGTFRAVDSVNYSFNKNEIVSIVGESGSGKSVSMLALMGLLPTSASVTADKMIFNGENLLGLDTHQRRKIVGNDMTMIFQEPMSSLNPCFRIGFQIVESLRQHVGGTKRECEKVAIELLGRVGIPAPEKRMKAYPHQLSGGMCQRVMIAMMIACKPQLLIADEPTTALDVTIQSQILDLISDLQHTEQMSIVLITHDMAVVAETADRVIVQYAGQQVEQQNVEHLFDHPKHPYTQALLAALPERAAPGKLKSIPGVVPGQNDKPRGCLFNPRCEYAQPRCREEAPLYKDHARCHFPIPATQ
ncbi:ATP-binding cassette domain-containing protein [Aurantivibrio plasticivorans]